SCNCQIQCTEICASAGNAGYGRWQTHGHRCRCRSGCRSTDDRTTSTDSTTACHSLGLNVLLRSSFRYFFAVVTKATFFTSMLVNRTMPASYLHSRMPNEFPLFGYFCNRKLKKNYKGNAKKLLNKLHLRNR